MRTLLVVTAMTWIASSTWIAGSAPSLAQGPESHPYCALDSSSGATSCYYDSRAQCGSHCIDNPSYVGSPGAMASTRGRDRLPRR